MEKTNTDREYAVTVLIACIDFLAKELSVKTDSDSNYLIAQSMLSIVLTLQYSGLERSKSVLETEYGWLIDHLENLIY